MKLTYKINRSTGYIFDYLTNMEKFASVHPVITKIKKQTDGGYLVYETLNLWFISRSFTYPVIISGCPDENIVIMTASVTGTTKIEMTFSLRISGNFTIVEENIVFKSPWLVKSILERIFKKQHKKLFNNIEKS